jgi:hypothetical protein
VFAARSAALALALGATAGDSASVVGSAARSAGLGAGSPIGVATASGGGRRSALVTVTRSDAARVRTYPAEYTARIAAELKATRPLVIR